MERIPQSATIRVPLQAYLASDHVSPATGKTIAITISKNGAAYGNPSAGATNATEIGSGSYYVDLSATDTGTAGPLFILGTCSGVDAVNAIYNVVNANNGGLAALPDTACTTNASLLTSGTGTAQISAASGVVSANATQLAGQTVTAAAGVTFPTSVASPTNITAGTITTATSVTNAVTVDGASPLTEDYATKAGALTVAKALYGITQQLGEMGIVGTTMTVKKRDGLTSAKTYTLDSATAPTSITEAS